MQTTGLPYATRPREPVRHAPFAVIAPLMGAALLLGAGGGFALAAVLTLTRAFRIPPGSWWAALVQAHGHLQLYGWAGLFVLGVALHFLPRLRGTPLALPVLLPWIAVTLVAGLLLRMASQPLLALTGVAIWRWGLVTSGALECLGVGGTLLLAFMTAGRGAPLRGQRGLWGVLPFFAIAFGALAIAAMNNLVGVAQAASTTSGLVPASGDNLNVTLGLLGFLVPVALAMSARSLPMYAGLEPFPRRILWPAWAIYLVGLIAAAVGAAGGFQPRTWLGTFAGLGLLLMGSVLMLFVAVFVWMIGARGKLPRHVAQLAPSPHTAERGYRQKIADERVAFGPYVGLVASAYLWAFLGALLFVLIGLALMLGAPPPIPVDAARHALALGFIALLIAGIASRMIPGFSGGRIASPTLVTAILWLGNMAALLRVGPLLLPPLLTHLGATGATVSAIAFGSSGPLGLAFATCLAINLWPAIWPSPGAAR